MAVLGVRRAFGTIWKRKLFRSMRQILQIRIFFHLFRIALSFVLLPLDNTILLVVVVVGHLSSFFSHSDPVNRRRTALQDVRFYPKTVLITGLDTPYGLALARCWFYEGHRVVGADIGDIPLSSGESMSKALAVFYRIPKSRYVSRLLDIIHREKVDIWIPCSQSVSAMDDAVAKQAIETKTSCKCITLGPEIANQWGRSESFTQYLVERNLPVVERHQVHSRDSIHKILHRSPTKVYYIRKTTPGMGDDRLIILPKKTMSLTYSEVSEIQVSKDSPWLMQHYARMGEFLAELLVVQGHLCSIKIRPANRVPEWGQSPLNEGLATAIHKLMDRFAAQGGAQITGHFCLQLMVDEELDLNSVRYSVHIAGCTQGAAAVKGLLRDNTSLFLVNAYLTVLSPESESENGLPISGSHPHPKTSISRAPSRRAGLYQIVKGYDVRRVIPVLYPLTQQVDHIVNEAGHLFLFWKNWRFSPTDPLPWWWHAHVSQPLHELDWIVRSRGRKAS